MAEKEVTLVSIPRELRAEFLYFLILRGMRGIGSETLVVATEVAAKFLALRRWQREKNGH